MTCTSTYAENEATPQLEEGFPSEGIAGHRVDLVLRITHQKNESVFPASVRFDSESDEYKELTAAQFHLPAPGSVDAVEQRVIAEFPERGQVQTEVRIPFIGLPRQTGKVSLSLPSLPVTLARASGRLEHLCTQTHSIELKPPTVPNQELAPDPESRPQLELWKQARDLSAAFLILLPLLLLLAWLGHRLWKRRQERKPPPPPTPPWELALEQLRSLEEQALLEQGLYAEHLEGLTSTLREYLGNRYGFDGLESTTVELLAHLEGKGLELADEKWVRTLLRRSDLVKFARISPRAEECEGELEHARAFVRKTTPSPKLDPRPSTSGGPA